MASIYDLTSKYIIAKYEHGDMRKSEVIALLEDDYPLTHDLRMMIAGILRGDGKPLANGRTGPDKYARSQAVRMVRDFMGWIEDPGKARDYFGDEVDEANYRWFQGMHARAIGKRRRDHKTALQLAKELVAGSYGVTVSTINQWIREVNAKG